jgi:hypothetical protein
MLQIKYFLEGFWLERHSHNMGRGVEKEFETELLFDSSTNMSKWEFKRET